MFVRNFSSFGQGAGAGAEEEKRLGLPVLAPERFTGSKEVLTQHARNCSARYMEVAPTRLLAATRFIKIVRQLMLRLGNALKWDNLLSDLQQAAFVDELQVTLIL